MFPKKEPVQQYRNFSAMVDVETEQVKQQIVARGSES